MLFVFLSFIARCQKNGKSANIFTGHFEFWALVEQLRAFYQTDNWRNRVSSARERAHTCTVVLLYSRLGYYSRPVKTSVCTFGYLVQYLR